MKRIVSFLMLLLLLISCKKDQKELIDVSSIQVNFNINRFEESFYNSSENELDALKNEYPLLFPIEVPDSVWISKMNSEEEQYLFKESQNVFHDFSTIKFQLTSLFKHIKYYNPKFKSPNIITYISDLDYEYPVIYSDSLLFISLDMYLGSENIVYKDFPSYLSQNYIKERVVVDIAEDIINQSYPKSNSRIFLDKIIQKGREAYLKEMFLPSVSAEVKMGYSYEKLEWAIQNEINIWKYFMENELLYSTDASLDSRFIDVAPFSKFYKEFDQESPGQIGIWMGWQIVHSFMSNNDVTLHQLMTLSPEEIFKKSKYKPRK